MQPARMLRLLLWARRALAVSLLVCDITAMAFAGDLPDLEKTPGVSRAGLTKAKICTIKWGIDARHVTASMKSQVFALYGLSGNDDPRCVPDAHGRHCEIDHLISRELGGADVVKNLWPQPYGTIPWNAALKDKLENRLNKEMCKGTITLQQARQMLLDDWRVAYQKYYAPP
jgi:hypothetical protein